MVSNRQNVRKKVLRFVFPRSLQWTFSDSVTVATRSISETCAHKNLMSTDVCTAAMSRETVAFNLSRVLTFIVRLEKRLKWANNWHTWVDNKFLLISSGAVRSVDDENACINSSFWTIIKKIKMRCKHKNTFVLLCTQLHCSSCLQPMLCGKFLFGKEEGG